MMGARGGGTRPQEYLISDLLALIADGELVLPEFQRDFDWNDERVVQLLATVVRGWPAGSLLLQEYEDGVTFFRIRGFDGGPVAERHAAQQVVLDGQQRLTALYHAVYDAGPYVYAIRASALRRGATIDDLEEATESFRRADWDLESRNRPFGDEHDWIPFYSLRSPADFFAWRDDVVARSEESERTDLAYRLSEAYRHGLESFHKYSLPAVIVERNLEPAAIARIFERVNRGGLPLTTFDLMVARTYERDWNLRDKWDEARASFSVLDDYFGDDGMPIIRAIALRNVGTVRESDVLLLPGQSVRSAWEDGVLAVVDAIEVLRRQCGVLEPGWLPYGGMLTTLAGLAFELPLGHHAEDVRRWFLSRAFGLTYEAAANTRTVEEYSHLREVFRGDAELRRVELPGRVIRSATRKRLGAVWRAFMATLAINGARDLVTGAPLAVEDDRRPAPLLPRDSVVLGEAGHLLVLNVVLSSRGSARRVLAEPDVVLDEAAARNDGTLSSQLLRVAPEPGLHEALIDGRLGALSSFLAAHLGYGLFGDHEE